MSDITAYDIRVRLPSGWDGRIARRGNGRGSTRGQISSGGGSEHPVVHLGTFALPEKRGDFGSGAVEQMRATDVLLCLIEFDGADRDSALFARTGVPRFRAQDFSPNSMQRTIAGMCGAQAFFTEAGRAFCAYAVLGSYRGRASLVRAVNDALAGVHISASATAG
jgi:hypothetical protein